VGDLNADGEADIVATSDSNLLKIFWGAGDGRFPTRSEYGANGDPDYVAIADVDGDGANDLLVTDIASQTIGVFPGPDFARSQSYPLAARPYALVVADVSGDGKPDVLVSYEVNGSLGVLLGGEHGSFGASREYRTGDYPSGIALGDFNMDGLVDVALATAKVDSLGLVNILLGVGGGAFSSPHALPVGGTPVSVAAGDVDGDGRLDLVSTNQGSSSISLLRGRGDGTFAPKVDYPTGSNPVDVALGDLNDDERLDIVVATRLASTVEVLFNSCGPPPAIPGAR
jgi:hypothetical protein